MKKLLVLRHIPYVNMMSHIDKLNDYQIDVMTTTPIPIKTQINDVILFKFDIYFNASKTPKKWLSEIKKYDYIVVFQSDVRLTIPDNIIKFVEILSDKSPNVMVIDDKYNVNIFKHSEFNTYFKNFESQVIFPKRLSISISDKCNLKCEFCFRHSESEYKIMNLNNIMRLPKELFENAVDVELSGYGEILMNQDLFEIMNYISEFDSVQRISFTTNATMLTHATTDALMKYEKLKLIQISIDTLRPKLYERIRKNASYMKVLSNINHLSKNKTSNVSVFLKMVLTNETIDDLIPMINYTKYNNFDRLIILPMHISKSENIAQSTYFNKKYVNAIYDEARQMSEKIGISLTLPPNFDLSIPITLDETAMRDYANHPCAEPNEVMYIQANGDVYPCCFSTDSYGNLYEKSLREIWHGHKYATLRKSVNTNNCPEYCKVCGMTENVDNLYFMIKKGEDFREPNILESVKEYINK